MELHHCGIEPLFVDGETWEVPEDEEPFDGTTVSDTFVGTGNVDQRSETELIYTDASGLTLRLVPGDGHDRPCD